MLVLELYFLFYRIPKMMTRLARERGLSAWRWSLLGIGAWLGAEFAVALGAGLVYAVGSEFFDWPQPVPPGFKALSYLLALVAALLSVTLVSKILMRQSNRHLPVPPSPPEFPTESSNAN
jgi:hypothetical protein